MDYSDLYDALQKLNTGKWVADLKKQIPAKLDRGSHGDLKAWLEVLDSLPVFESPYTNFNLAAVTATSDQPAPADLKTKLMAFHPWRKGPFHIHGIEIDAEWRSDLKWKRLQYKISPLQSKLVLDVGCGNGYYGWRMLGSGAKMVIGIEPFLKNVIQFFALQNYLGQQPFFVLPLGIEELPPDLGLFDTVFSMGVLYHRRSPFDHLMRLKSFLKPGGELVLETIIIDGDQNSVLVPPGKYAKMRNVWFLPSVKALQNWLKRSGFSDIKCIDISPTTTFEQRKTEWMQFESLSDFLDPGNPKLTIEQLPAPIRAIFTARKN